MLLQDVYHSKKIKIVVFLRKKEKLTRFEAEKRKKGSTDAKSSSLLEKIDENS